MKIYTSEADSKYLLFHGTHGISYISEDCGANIRAIEHQEDFIDFKLNPIEGKM